MDNIFLVKAKEERSKKWHIGSYNHDEETIIDCDGRIIKVDKETICACTGMFDNKQKLIFNNDMVQFDDGEIFYVYRDNTGAFKLTDIDEFIVDNAKYISVIGNSMNNMDFRRIYEK